MPEDKNIVFLYFFFLFITIADATSKLHSRGIGSCYGRHSACRNRASFVDKVYEDVAFASIGNSCGLSSVPANLMSLHIMMGLVVQRMSTGQLRPIEDLIFNDLESAEVCWIEEGLECSSSDCRLREQIT